MNNSELIQTLAKRLDMNQKEISELLLGTVSVISKQLNDDNIVSIPPVGTLEAKRRMERINVNPVTGKRFLVPPKRIVSFKPLTSLKDKIREEENE